MAYVPRNRNDYTGRCQKDGNRAEKLFESLAIEKGGRVEETTTDQDARQHQDRFIWDLPELGNGRIAVDVRSRPHKVNVTLIPPEMRMDSHIDFQDPDAFTLMETKGRGRTAGRIFGTQSNYFAQERVTHFDVYTTKSLRELTTRFIRHFHMDVPITKTPYIQYEPYKLYLRLDDYGHHSGEYFFIPTYFLNILCARIMSAPPIKWIKQ